MKLSILLTDGKDLPINWWKVAMGGNEPLSLEKTGQPRNFRSTSGQGRSRLFLWEPAEEAGQSKSREGLHSLAPPPETRLVENNCSPLTVVPVSARSVGRFSFEEIPALFLFFLSRRQAPNKEFELRTLRSSSKMKLRVGGLTH